jgi:hypothetical protein
MLGIGGFGVGLVDSVMATQTAQGIDRIPPTIPIRTHATHAATKSATKRIMILTTIIAV